MTASKDGISILISEEEISQRVLKLAHEIDLDFAGKEVVIVGILNGTILFLSDLIRQVKTPLKVDFVGTSSYGENTFSGNLVWTKQLNENIRNKHVIIVEDILETGQTLHHVLKHIQASEPKSVKTCILLSKNVNRNFHIDPDYVGFEIEDEFVVGYGLDYDGSYRNLPYIGIFNSKGKLNDQPLSQPEEIPNASKINPETINVTVRYWSFYQSITGQVEEKLSLPVNSTVEDLQKKITSVWPALKEHESSMLVAIGNDYHQSSYKLKNEDNISLFPPVQGG